MPHTDSITVNAAAELRGVSPHRIRQYITEGRLPAERMGREYLVRRRDVDRMEVADVGRPKLVKS